MSDARARRLRPRTRAQRRTEAGAPKLIPVPSLLRSLLSEHLDPGYAAAAAERSAGSTTAEPVWRRGWQVLAALLVATVFAAAVAQARPTAPGVRESQQVLAGSVRSAEETTNQAISPPRPRCAEARRRTARRLDGRRRGQAAARQTSTARAPRRRRRRSSGPG